MEKQEQRRERNSIKVKQIFVKQGDLHCFYINELKLLGEGSHGKVYEAYFPSKYDKNILEKCVCKVINIQKNENELKQILNIVKSEYLVLENQENHQNLVKYKHIIMESKNNVYLLMEYCNQKTLHEYIKDNNQPLQEEDICRKLYQICQGYLSLIKKKIIHRDLKPKNILLHNNQIKIGDFGYAKILNPQNMQASKIAFSHGFICPEATKGAQQNKPYDLDYKNDMYSLGIILFQMMYKQEQIQENLHHIKGLIHSDPQNKQQYAIHGEDIQIKKGKVIRQFEIATEEKLIENGQRTQKIVFPTLPERTIELKQLNETMLNQNVKERISFDELDNELKQIIKQKKYQFIHEEEDLDQGQIETIQLDELYYEYDSEIRFYQQMQEIEHTFYSTRFQQLKQRDNYQVFDFLDKIDNKKLEILQKQRETCFVVQILREGVSHLFQSLQDVKLQNFDFKPSLLQALDDIYIFCGYIHSEIIVKLELVIQDPDYTSYLDEDYQLTSEQNNEKMNKNKDCYYNFFKIFNKKSFSLLFNLYSLIKMPIFQNGSIKLIYSQIEEKEQKLFLTTFILLNELLCILVKDDNDHQIQKLKQHQQQQQIQQNKEQYQQQFKLQYQQWSQKPLLDKIIFLENCQKINKVYDILDYKQQDVSECIKAQQYNYIQNYFYGKIRFLKKIHILIKELFKLELYLKEKNIQPQTLRLFTKLTIYLINNLLEYKRQIFFEYEVNKDIDKNILNLFKDSEEYQNIKNQNFKKINKQFDNLVMGLQEYVNQDCYKIIYVNDVFDKPFKEQNQLLKEAHKQFAKEWKTFISQKQQINSSQIQEKYQRVQQLMDCISQIIQFFNNNNYDDNFMEQYYNIITQKDTI